jgi:hypothetical protein
VRVSIGLTVLLLLALPGTGSAQSWKLALERGDDAAAVRLLGSLVFEEILPPADEAEQLATLYHDGRGVSQDKVLACSLLDLAARSARARSVWGQPNLRLEGRRDATCSRLSADERLEARQLMGCAKFGPDRQSYALDDGDWVDISRRGIRVHHKDVDSLHDLPGIVCNQQVLRVRYTRLAPSGPGQSRHFLEFFSALRRTWPDDAARSDLWQLVEIVRGSVRLRGVESLGNAFEPPDRLAQAPAVHLQAREDGAVTWRFEDGRFSGNVEALEAEPPPPDEFSAPEPGTGRVDVKVTDRFGAPMPGVTVTLTGVTSAALQTEATGVVSFADLPDGRYDVVASLKGLPSSLPRVIDLAGLATTVEIVLKPSAPIGWVVHSCGWMPRTLEQLAADADAIARVKVERQRSYRRKDRHVGDPGFIMTASTVRWIESFKSNSRVTIDEEIVQGGGRLEKADEIEITTFNDAAPLNIGDEYVLFLKRYDELGYVVIHHAQNGAFLIRNGRVNAVGKAFAQTWKDRSSARFFEALRTSLKARTTR